MNKTDTIPKILDILDEHYPIDKCYLSYNKPYELLIATILSAQCTDKQVNTVTAVLFAKYPTLEAFAGADLIELERDIKPTGFFRVKARNIVAASRELLESHGGELPSDINLLTKLPGVGRKTANVVLGHIFGIPSIVVDTHVARVSVLLGITDKKDPTRIEFDLMDKLPSDHWIRYNTQVIAHGRKICIANRPKCGECCLRELCDTHMNNFLNNFRDIGEK